MSERETTPWYRPTAADLLFLLIAIVVLRGARHTLLDDPGLGWHIRNIDAILAEGRWLTKDPFTDPRDLPPPEYYTNQWLGDLPFWIGWKWSGLEGIAAVNAIVIAILAGSLYRILLADGIAWPIAMLWTTVGMMGSSCSWNARPNVFTLLFVLWTARGCVLLHEDRLTLRGACGLVLMFIAWANVHGGFVAGLIILGLTTAIEAGVAVAGLDIDIRSQARGRFWKGMGISCAAALATLINPYGYDLYRWVFLLLGDPYFMSLHQEWRSPDFQSGGAMRYEMVILLLPAMLGLSQRRPTIVELALIIVWLHFALTGFRYMALWVIVVVPVLARQSMEIPYLVELARRLELHTGPGSLFHTPTTARAPWIITVCLGLVLLGGVRVVQGRFAVHKQDILATNAMDRLLVLARDLKEREGRRLVIIHGYDWGGYLTWHGWPEFLNWIDDRNEVQGKERIEEYFDLMQARPGWEATVSKADLICVPAAAPLRERLRSHPELWSERYADRMASIFERKPGR